MSGVWYSTIVRKIFNFLLRYRVLIFLLVIFTILRIPSLFEPYWYGDEGIYLTVGNSLRAGLKLYAEIVDHKTPLIYWFSALSGSLFWFRVLLLISSLTSISLFYLLARRLFKNSLAVLVSTMAFSLLTTLPAFEGNIANGEILLMPFVLGGVWWFWQHFPRSVTASKLQSFYSSVRWTQPFILGVLFSLALLTKVPSGFDLVAWVLFFVLFVPHQWQSRTFLLMLRYLLFAALGVLLPILISILFFLFRGTLIDYLELGLFYNFRYIQAWGTPFVNPIAIFLSSMLGRVLTLLIGLAGLYRLRGKLGSRLVFTCLWLLLTLFASLLSLRPYPHYFIQVMPALALLLGFFVLGSRTVKVLLTSLILVVIWLLVQFRVQLYPTLSYYTNFLNFVSGKISRDTYYSWFDQKTLQTYHVANWLVEHTDKDERIFIWGNEPMVYALSERIPVARFIVDFHIVSFNAYDETMSSLQDAPPKFVVVFEESPEFPDLQTFLSEAYRFEIQIEAATIYRIAIPS